MTTQEAKILHHVKTGFLPLIKFSYSAPETTCNPSVILVNSYFPLLFFITKYKYISISFFSLLWISAKIFPILFPLTFLHFLSVSLSLSPGPRCHRDVGNLTVQSGHSTPPWWLVISWLRLVTVHDYAILLQVTNREAHEWVSYWITGLMFTAKICLFMQDLPSCNRQIWMELYQNFPWFIWNRCIPRSSF